MEHRDNYALQVRAAQAYFQNYDQEALIRKFSLAHDETYLYFTMAARPYRLRRWDAALEKMVEGLWRDGNSHSEVMTALDVICDAKENRFLTGRWKSMQNFGLQFHRTLLEDRPTREALAFDRDPAGLAQACRTLGGRALPGADVSFALPLLLGLEVCLQFWQGDEEFAPRLYWLWDENALMYIKYETMYFAVNLLLSRLEEEMARKGAKSV